MPTQIKRIAPQPGQESVWDYPRPPRVELSHKHIHVVFNGVTIAETNRAHRVLETSHPPVYYIPIEDIKREYLAETAYSTYCEFKDAASYYDLNVDGRISSNAGWFYRNPSRAFTAIKDAVAFYAGRVDACYVDDEKVQPQEGNFYGGWITSDVVGPFKGGPGTQGW